MPWVDDSGKQVSAEEVGTHFQSYPVTTPSELGPQIARAAGKVVPRAGAMTAGAEIGGALGALTPVPGGAEIGAAAGSGLANLAGKYLPEALGGDPKESKTRAFLTGAVPEALARGAAAGLAQVVARRSAEGAHDAITAALEKGPMPAEQAGTAAGALGRTLERPPLLTGEKLTDATNRLRDTVLGPINRERRRLGEPIGQAYDALKDNQEAISEAEAQELADAARGVRDSLIAPAPKAKAIFDRIKRFVLPQGEGTQLSGFIQKDLQELGHGELLQRNPTAESLRLQNYSESQITKILSQYQPPTLDELREVRQRVNIGLRTAQGGDVHALLSLQQALDEKLLPRLPATIGRDRELYAGFIKRYPWRDVNRIRQLGTPRELGQYVFGGGPERTAELIAGASRSERQALGEALKDRVLSGVNPDLPPEEQIKQIYKGLEPYLADGTAAKLFGATRADELREVLYAPIHRQQMARILSQPEQHDAFVKEWARIAQGAAKSQLTEAEAGFEKVLKVLQSLPPAELQRFLAPSVPGAAMPALPTTEEAIARGMLPSAKSPMVGYATRRMAFAGPQAAARAAMGGGAGVAYGAATAAAFAVIATTSAGYKALMENGGAGMVARLYASPNGRAAARALLEALTALGTQTISQSAKDQATD